MYLPEVYYRKIKHIHHDLNLYSIAQIMRKLIGYYLNSYKKYGFIKLESSVGEIKKKWDERKKMNNKVEYGSMIQLFNKIHTPLSMIISYDIYSRPKAFEFPKNDKIYPIFPYK